MATLAEFVQICQEELSLLGTYLQDTTYDFDVLQPAPDMPVPSLAVTCEMPDGEDCELVYMILPSGEEDEEEPYGHTYYLQALCEYPAQVQGAEALFDTLLFINAVNQQLPLGCVSVQPDNGLLFRHVFAVDRELILTRETFQETLFVMHFILQSTLAALRPLASGDMPFEKALEVYLAQGDEDEGEDAQDDADDGGHEDAGGADAPDRPADAPTQ